MRNRPYRLFHGVAYPNLYQGDNQPTKIQATSGDPEELYYDSSVRLSSKEVESFIGKPICVEHHPELDVGRIAASWQDSEGDMRVDIHVYTDNEAGKLVCSQYDAGELGELSVGYEFATSNGEVQEKYIKEISFCKKGFFDGARISVAASEKSKYKNPVGILFKVTAMQSEMSKDAAELLRRNDEMTKRLQELEAQSKNLEEQNKRYAEEDKMRIAEYGKKQEPLLREVLNIQEQQWKEEHGTDSQLPASHKEVTTNAFMQPEAYEVMQAITASANSWKRQKAESEAMKAKLLQQEQEMTAFRTEVQRVTASHEKATALTGAAAAAATAPVTEVNASGKSNLSNLFIPAPSSAEQELARSAYPQMNLDQISQVHASGGRKVQEVRAHAFVDRTPNSMNHHRQGSKSLFAHLVGMDYQHIPIYNLNAKTTELEK
jgi:hypothetical protein